MYSFNEVKRQAVGSVFDSNIRVYEGKSECFQMPKKCHKMHIADDDTSLVDDDLYN